MLIAGGLVDAARDFHPSFNEEQHPDKGLLRQLSRDEKRLIGLLAERSEDRVASSITWNQDVIGVNAFAGTPLIMPQYVSLVDAKVYMDSTTGNEAPVLITASRQHPEAIVRGPQIHVQGQLLYLLIPRGVPGYRTGWEAFNRLTVRYIPVAPPLTTLEQVLTIPDFAETALVENLAAWLAGRVPGLQLSNVNPGAAEMALLRSADLTPYTWNVRIVE